MAKGFFKTQKYTAGWITLSIAGGIIYALSFPKFEMWFFVPPAFYIFFLITEGTHSIIYPFLYGFASNLTLLYWLIPTMTVYGGLSIFLSGIIYAVLCAYLSIYWVLFFWFTKIFLKQTSLFSAVLIPAFWVFLELVKGHAFSGFPWALTGYSIYKLKLLIQIADITGVYGLSFMCVLSGLFLYDIIEWKTKRLPFSASLFLLLILGTTIYGHKRINKIKNIEGESVKVGLIQGNFKQDIKWNPLYRKRTMDVYFSLTEKAINEGAQLVVWPETAVPFFYQSNRMYSAKMRNFVKKYGIHLIFGSPAFKIMNRKTRFFNRIYLLTPEGKEFFYDKIHLVPFGEYVPLPFIFGFAEKFFTAVGNMTPGKEFKLLPYKSHLIGGYICYEAIFPELVRIFKKNGAEVFVNITNDAWFGRTSAPYQHISMATLRSVENRVFTVRVANTGVTAVITPIGEILNPTPIFKRTYEVEEVKFLNLQTFYSNYGDVFAYTMSILSFTSLLWLYFKPQFRGKKEI